ncbi:glycosyltransferase [Tenacibaculum sp. MSW2]|nr:glycosyltransferase [Tenacibaculum aquimarinum]
MSVARFNTSKGQETLLKAIPIVLKDFPNYIFIFVGSGILLKKQKQLAKTLNIDKSCLFCGNLPQEKVYELMQMSKLHVSTSKDEAFGIVNLEAISLGTPLLAPKVGGIPEILENNINGFFYNKNDYKDLAFKIIEIISSDKIYKRLVKGSITTFEEKFLLNKSNLQKIVSQIEKK